MITNAKAGSQSEYIVSNHFEIGVCVVIQCGLYLTENYGRGDQPSITGSSRLPSVILLTSLTLCVACKHRSKQVA